MGKNRLRKNRNSYYFIILTITILVGIGIFLINKGINYKQKKEPIYYYTVQKNDDYGVLLKENNFYDSTILPSGIHYASKSINEIMVNFQYKFTGNKHAEIKYQYNIVAKLIATVKENDNQDEEVWQKVINYTDNKNGKTEEGKFYISEDANVDYNYYNNLINLYEEEYGIVTDATLKLRFNISYNINLSKSALETEKVDDYIEIEIPITNTVTEINENYQKTAEKSIYGATEKINSIQIIFISMGILFIIGAIIIIVIIIKENKMKTVEEIYQTNMNSILKYYKYLIVTVNNEPNISNLRLMNVSKLEDLIDVAEQHQTNIIHYEKVKNKQNNLYVIIDNYVYMFIIT